MELRKELDSLLKFEINVSVTKEVNETLKEKGHSKTASIMIEQLSNTITTAIKNTDKLLAYLISDTITPKEDNTTENAVESEEETETNTPYNRDCKCKACTLTEKLLNGGDIDPRDMFSPHIGIAITERLSKMIDEDLITPVQGIKAAMRAISIIDKHKDSISDEEYRRMFN